MDADGLVLNLPSFGLFNISQNTGPKVCMLLYHSCLVAVVVHDRFFAIIHGEDRTL